MCVDLSAAPYFFRCWLRLLEYGTEQLCHTNRHAASGDESVRERFAWPQGAKESTLQCVGTIAVTEYFGKMMSTPQTAFETFAAVVHTLLDTMTIDPLCIRRAKAVTLCGCIQTIMEASHKHFEFHVESGSMLSLVAPYLIMAAQTGAMLAPDAPQRMKMMALEVELMGLETMAELVTLWGNNRLPPRPLRSLQEHALLCSGR